MAETRAQPDFSTVPERLGEEIHGPGKTFFDQVVIDNLMDAVMELSAQLWITRDRLYVLERVLESQGTDVAKAIEAWAPDDAERAERDALRKDLVERVFNGFARRAE